MNKKVYKKTMVGIREKFPDESKKKGQPEPPGTISFEEAKEFLRDAKLTDEQILEAKEQVRLMVEIIYEKWLQDRKKRDNQTE